VDFAALNPPYKICLRFAEEKRAQRRGVNDANGHPGLS
jgi:hypothetical protein